MLVILHNLRSLHNVGSIFRTADAAGIKKIYLTGITPSPRDRFGVYRSQFSKVSLGAEKYIDWKKISNVGRLISDLKRGHYKVFAAEQSKKSIPYFSVKVKDLDRVVLLVGNEVRGLSPSLLKNVDKILEIPMRGKMVRQACHSKNHPEQSRGKESLNVAVAFGIIAFTLINSRSYKRI